VYSVYAEDPSASEDFVAFKQDTSDHLKLLVCIDMLNEGVHVEDISGVILFRPTVSPILYKQQIGRALSANRRKDPVILDIVNNFDNLYSISAVQEEMRDAAVYYRDLGEGARVATEGFEIVDEVRDCRQLFQALQKSLSAPWGHYFTAAKAYHKQHGNLNVPAPYKTERGLSLGSWLHTQRRIRAGKATGHLTDQQVAKLDSLGMVWDASHETDWARKLARAQAYYEANGHLNCRCDHVLEDGFALGAWLARIRTLRNQGLLESDRIEQLDAMGMVWDKADPRWTRNYESARRFYEANGHLDVPSQYVDAGGIRLGAWIHYTRDGKGRRALTQEQTERLDAIGMIWGSKSDLTWNRKYEEAKAYHLEHGDLDVPAHHITPRGTALGRWVYLQRQARLHPDKQTARLTEQRIAKLVAIGMNWVQEYGAWNAIYERAHDYYNHHGCLPLSQKYVTEDGVWLGKWLYTQRRVLEGQAQGKCLTEAQVEKLRAIGLELPQWGEHAVGE
jgi:hypothetical protein